MKNLEHLPFSNKENIELVNPQELFADNPAANIVNPESYRLISAKFDWDMFDSVKIARVITYDSQGTVVIKRFVVDGHTRTKYAADQGLEVIPTEDKTQHYLKNPIVTLSEEEMTERGALTLPEYLRAIIPATKAQEVIARPRIAAHIVNAWRNMVGEEQAQRYPITVALRLLANSQVPKATNEILARYLKSQQIREQEGQGVEEGLLQINAVISEFGNLGISASQVAEAAFELIAGESPVIGGTRETERQIYGFLYRPLIEAKLTRLHPNLSQRELRREQLAQGIVASIRRSEKTEEKRETLKATFNSLDDHHFTLDQAFEVIQSDNPQAQYETLVREVNYLRLSEAYLRTQVKEALTETEQKLLDNLGRIRYLPDTTSGLITVINTAQQSVSRADSELTQLEAQRADLLRKGVRTETLDSVISQIRDAQDKLINSSTPNITHRNTIELTATTKEGQQKIESQIHMHATTTTIEQVFGQEPTVGFGRSNIVSYMLHQIEIGDLRPTDIERRIRELYSLNPQLQERVVSGFMRITVALARQQSPEQQKQQLQQSTALEITKPEDQSMTQAELPDEIKTVLPVKPVVTIEHRAAKTLDIQTRIQENNNFLNTGVIFLLNRLGKIDLDNPDVTSENRELIIDLIDKLGLIGLGIADLVRKGEEYDKQISARSEELERRVQKDMVDSEEFKDKRV